MKYVEIIGEAPVIGADYFSQAFEPKRMKSLIRWFRNNVDLKKFDLIVGTGTSGSAVVPVLANALNKRFALVRRNKQSSHAAAQIAGNIEPGDRWIFVDDFTETGKTLKRVKQAIQKEVNFKGKQRRTWNQDDEWHQGEIEGFNIKYVGYVFYERHRGDEVISPELMK